MTPQGYKKHKKWIELWADGAKIQEHYQCDIWHDKPIPDWSENKKYRINPAQTKWYRHENEDCISYIEESPEGFIAYRLDKREERVYRLWGKDYKSGKGVEISREAFIEGVTTLIDFGIRKHKDIMKNQKRMLRGFKEKYQS